MNKIVVITGASSGFGALTARALARAGHTVYASMRGTTGRNAAQVAEAADYASEHGVDLRTVELDVASAESVDRGVAAIMTKTGRIDVVIHNAGHMSFGPAEAFTPEQFAELYDINVLSTQRVNRAVLPHMRKRGAGLVVWVSSSSARGGTPPYLSPYFAAKAAMDSLAVSYAGELARWGIETSIIVPRGLYQGDEPLRPCRYASRRGASRGIRRRTLRGRARTSAERVGLAGTPLNRRTQAAILLEATTRNGTCSACGDTSRRFNATEATKWQGASVTSNSSAGRNAASLSIALPGGLLAASTTCDTQRPPGCLREGVLYWSWRAYWVGVHRAPLGWQSVAATSETSLR